MKKQTQREWVLERLKQNGSITRNECLRNYITRLGAIICNLTNEGYQFDSGYVKVETFWGTSKDYKYTLKKPK